MCRNRLRTKAKAVGIAPLALTAATPASIDTNSKWNETPRGLLGLGERPPLSVTSGKHYDSGPPVGFLSRILRKRTETDQNPNNLGGWT